MCTVKLSYDQKNVEARKMLAAMLASGLFFVNENPEEKDMVYVEDGEVKWDFAEGTTDLESFRRTLHHMVDLEYSL